jgi:lipoprotein-anchoring transpeptidase ErfK/SrfK
MNPDPASARQALQNAQQAMQRGDRQAARRWAELAVAQDRRLEDAWLILAALAAPRASVAYLEEALKINPGSERARQGLRWAKERLDEERGRTRRAAPVRKAAAPAEATRPGRVPEALRPAPPENTPSAWSLTRYRRSFATLLLLMACLVLAWALWPGNASPALAVLRANIAPQFTPTDPGGPAQVDKPTYTPSVTPTPSPTATFTPTPTFTFTPTPTDTLTPTVTPIPTETATPWPTPFITATPLPAAANSTGGQVAELSGNGDRWIDVDLSTQTLYAYEGNTVVASFLVSTGVAQFPTVTGRFHIYVKYLYTDMAGPGYYLPNVPYTMYFYKGYGIHGTYWHHNFGHPMSHGCVNMYTPDAAWMFNFASVGTLVNVHY